MKRRKRTSVERGDLRVLTVAQRSELAEGFSVLGGRGTHFASEDERRAAWELHGDAITRAWRTPFARPRGFWICEIRRTPPPRGREERIALILMQALSALERRHLKTALSAEGRRALLQQEDFTKLPGAERLWFLGPDLLSGLTAKGKRHFLESLAPNIRAEVEAVE